MSDAFLYDLRHAVRRLAGSRGYAAVVVLTLSIAIGAVTAIFSVLHGALLRPLPFPKPEQLVMLYGTSPSRGIDRNVTSVPNFLDWRAQTTCFSHMAAVDQGTLNLTGMGEPEALAAGLVSASFFDVLRVRAAVGRTFVAGEDGDAAPPAVVLTDRLFRRRFGGRPETVGQALTLSEKSYTVVGVLPAGFEWPVGTDLYVPAIYADVHRNSRSSSFLPIVARMKDGVTLEEARRQMATVAARLAQEYPLANQGWSATAEPLHTDMVRDLRASVLVLFGAVAFVLLIACVNVANLALSRLTSRQRELAVRAALGAGRGRIVRQLLLESALLGIAGGTLGVLASGRLLQLLTALAPGLPPQMAARLDLPVLAFAVAVSLGTGLLFGIVPALHAGAAPAAALAGARGISATAGQRRSQRALVVAQVALALILLVGAGLLMRTLRQLVHAPLGFEPAGVLTAELELGGSRYDQPAARSALAVALVERLRALPGVTAASLVTTLPLGEIQNDTYIRVDGQPELPPEQRAAAGFDGVLPGYFRAMGIRLLQGSREIEESDGTGTESVAIVNEAMAKRYWPGQDALGRTFTRGERHHYRIVGVASSVRRLGLRDLERPHFYHPFPQLPRRRFAVVVRSAGDPLLLSAAVRQAIRASDPNVPVLRLSPLSSFVESAASTPRLLATLLGAFAAVAAALAALGLYGVLSYVVAQRTHDIGVRMALGARRADVLGWVLRQGLGLTTAGLLIGLAAAAAVTRFLTSLLYEVRPLDLPTFGAVTTLLMAAAVAACLLPALRAARVEPVVALREG